jgi:hypothetical protein
MRRLGIIVIVALNAGCGSEGPSGSNGTITVEAGANQTAAVGNVLQIYQVKISSGADAVPGVTVAWSVVAGGGSVAPATTVTDGQGLAEATATLGTSAGSQIVRAKASGYSPAVFTATATAGPPASILKQSGDDQVGPTSQALPAELEILVSDRYGNRVQGATVNWAVTGGGGTVSTSGSTTDIDGRASAARALGPTAGPATTSATVAGAGSVSFTATAILQLNFTVLGGGNNVPNHLTSDLWVQDGFAYTGTWGFTGLSGKVVKIWQLSPSGAPILKDSIVVEWLGIGINTVSDIQVSEDGHWLVLTAELESPQSGLYVYELPAPGTPVFRAHKPSGTGLHTGSLATIGGKLYAFAAKDPSEPALEIYDLSQAGLGTVTLASTTPIPQNYGIHDTFVRDGYAFVFAWNEGVYIFDVGNGSYGGSPTSPVQISHTPGLGGATHNGWWFWNPKGQKKYLFLGQEGPAVIGSKSSGDIHVVDVSDLAAPVEVGFYHISGAGPHNFWIDESNQVLYAAYYNAGVVALDISGTISGSMASREIARLMPGGPGNTYTWGVQLYKRSIYASDMLSGLWQLSLPH